MQLSRNPKSVPSTPQKFQILGSRLTPLKDISHRPPRTLSPKPSSLCLKPSKPLPCNFKSQSLDHKLSLFFHKRQRPRPRTLAPRSVDQLLKKQTILPQIETKRDTFHKTLQNMDLNYQSYVEINQVRQVSKTMGTEQEEREVRRVLRSTNKRKVRKEGVKKRMGDKKLKEDMFTKEGWRSQNREKWLFGITKIFQ